jgi:hypothetical protein
MSLTLSEIVRLVKETQREWELLHSGYVAHRQSFRAIMVSRELFVHEDASLPKELLFFSLVLLMSTLVMCGC